MAQRLVLIDDTNSNIQYSGPWFASENTQLNTGNFGPPFQNTLHGVNVNANLSFSFSGSSVAVLGTSITTNASGTQDPTWQCFVDNNSIGWNTVLQFAENNWILCQNSQLQDGPHVLSVEATVSNQQTFWFDQIQYTPSSNVSLDQSILRVDSSDPAMQYSSGWKALDGVVNITQTAGSTLTYNFSGISLTWFSYIPGHFPLISSSATYSVDGKTPVTFLVPALSAAGAIDLYNQILFQTGQLSAGQHKLVVTHQGNSSTAPLTLDYFVVQDAPSPSTSSGSPTSTAVISSSAPSNLGSTSSSTTTKPPLGAIIGGVFGGLILLFLISFLFIRRRKTREARRLSEKSYSDISYNIVDPFTVPPSHSTPILHSPQTVNNKLPHSGQPTNASSTTPPIDASSSVSGGGLPALTPLRNHSSTPAITSDSSSSSALPLAVAQTNLIGGVMTKAQEAEPVPAVQRSASPQSNPRFLRHEDSGVRMPPAEDDLVELPPLYTAS